MTCGCCARTQAAGEQEESSRHTIGALQEQLDQAHDITSQQSVQLKQVRFCLSSRSHELSFHRHYTAVCSSLTGGYEYVSQAFCHTYMPAAAQAQADARLSVFTKRSPFNLSSTYTTQIFASAEAGTRQGVFRQRADVPSISSCAISALISQILHINFQWSPWLKPGNVSGIRPTAPLAAGGQGDDEHAGCHEGAEAPGRRHGRASAGTPSSFPLLTLPSCRLQTPPGNHLSWVCELGEPHRGSLAWRAALVQDACRFVLDLIVWMVSLKILYLGPRSAQAAADAAAQQRQEAEEAATCAAADLEAERAASAALRVRWDSIISVRPAFCNLSLHVCLDVHGQADLPAAATKQLVG